MAEERERDTVERDKEERDDLQRQGRDHREMDPRTIYPGSSEEYSLSGDALHRDEIEQGGVGTSPAPGEGMQRYPTEAPDEKADKGD